MKIGHNELAIKLADHLKGANDRLIYCDMQLGPAGSPRPDVFTIRKSYAHPKPLAYEVKVSVSDFRSDITKGKWQSYLEFASGVHFVVPAGLISKADLPPGCGLITFNTETGAFHTAKAPTLQKVTMPETALMKLVIDGARRQHETYRSQHYSEYAARKKVSKKLGERVAAAVFDVEEVERAAESRRLVIQSKIDALQTDYERRKQFQDERLKRQEDQIEEQLLELKKTFGLPPDANWLLVRNKMQDVLAIVEKEPAIRDLQRQIERIRQAVDRPTVVDRATGSGL